MERHSKADEKYYIEAGKLLELARRAYELFESSEDSEKRELLNFYFRTPKWIRKSLFQRSKCPLMLSSLRTNLKLGSAARIRTWNLKVTSALLFLIGLDYLLTISCDLGSGYIVSTHLSRHLAEFSSGLPTRVSPN